MEPAKRVRKDQGYEEAGRNCEEISFKPTIRCARIFHTFDEHGLGRRSAGFHSLKAGYSTVQEE